MSAIDSSQVFERVREHAFKTLLFKQRETTNLYFDERVYREGDVIGPKRQGVVAECATILIFADDDPRANFSHPCRYLLYNAQHGGCYREVPAQFPPFVKAKPESLKLFHQPLSPTEMSATFQVHPPLRCPVIHSRANRYAIMFSGMSGKQPLNDMEFLYRTLVDVYGYEPNNIYVLHYDGTLNSWDGVPTAWPGDGTAYRIRISGEGTRPAFEALIDDLKRKLKRDDVLLIHTNQCGSWAGSLGTADLDTYPNWEGYCAGDFASKLGELPRFGKLMVIMGQCHSGGFSKPIITQSKAVATSVACAATESNSAFVSADGNWDSFARDWIAAQAGHDPFGAPLAFNPDTDGDGVIEAEEAFNYALSVQNPWDSPNYRESSEAGGDITLGQKYLWWRCWCWIILPILEKYYKPIPPDLEFYAKVRELTPQLHKLLAPVLDQSAVKIRKELTPKIEALVRAALKAR
jgi:hypothetical protein